MIKVIGKPDFEDKVGPRCHKRAPEESAKDPDYVLACTRPMDHKLDREYPHCAPVTIDEKVAWYAWR